MPYRRALWLKAPEGADAARQAWVPDLEQRAIPTTAGVDPLPLLASPGDQAQMQSEGLPADRVSLENGAIITNCARWPLIIDPQLQGIKWLRSRFADAKYSLKVTQLNNKNVMQTLRNSLEKGFVVIIGNLGQEIDALLDPIIARTMYKNWHIDLGGEPVEYDMRFKLFLLTKIDNPDYKPEIQAQTTLINFIATEAGLEDQLLARFVQKEEPELEKSKGDLVEQFTQ